ncbi:hypothetical protein TREPR_1866 [Treponema primitia ZAS-2]|uniref:DUF91 domain-containing protein n=1 Tax=Treponema primitia (strain ATCC BAA-887 / DSM 12427 / ZAS-2) TaxID=545694 RepID=F5YL62_TREPZ|nr:hypothetical protein [Treponema primitia]AEF85383.1 hypothetical protein TREPR_1866 [Treponema primitia ZAS-2]
MDRIVLYENDISNILFSTKYDNELEIQELVKNQPGIIELSSIFDSPLLIIGRETHRIDVLGITLSGIPVIVECKRKDNPDMRYLIAQIFEYGSALQNKNFDDLDTYARNYFNSERCKETKYKNKSLLEALSILKNENSDYDDISNENIQETIYNNLKEGNFYLLAVADEIDDITKGTIEFMNSKLGGLYIEMVEIKKYKANATIVFVPQHTNPTSTIHTNSSKKRVSSGIGKTTVEEMKSRGTTQQNEHITQIINIWENYDDCSIVMGTSGLSMRYKDIAIFWLFVDSLRIANPLKSQLKTKKMPEKLYDDILSVFKRKFTEKSVYIDNIIIEDFKCVSEAIYKLLNGVKVKES